MTKQTSTSSSSKKTNSTNAVNTELSVTQTSSTPTPVVQQKVRRGKKQQQQQQTEVVDGFPNSTQLLNVANIEENAIVNETEGNQVNEQIEFYSKLNQILSIVSSLKKDYKLIESKFARDLKIAQKTSGKKKKRQGTRTPSGFVKPTAISDELANFLGKEKGCEMARTAVTKEINNYIVQHNLKDKDNGRKINPDQKLNSLLKVEEGVDLTYFNLQRYMSPHFPKKAEQISKTSV